MVFKYIFGEPIETQAVVKPIEETPGSLPYFTTVRKEEGYSFTFRMGDKDKIWGLGQQVRGINKRGWLYRSNNTDDPEHTEGKHSLYGAHNFFVLKGETTFGVFFDYPGAMTFDFGYGKKEEMVITVPGEDFKVYILTEDKNSAGEIVREFRNIIGTSYIPPRWAFGYQQSRWSYGTEEEVYKVVKAHQDQGIPLEAVYLDIDYMERYKDFTIDRQKFPHMEQLIRDLKEQHIHLVPIIDAGVKIEEGYDVYQEGRDKGYFVTKEDGSYFTAGVWPGLVHLPDVLNDKAREWFGNGYQELIQMGVEGFWNDMNEPALFYSLEGLEAVLKKAETINASQMDLNDFLELQPLMNEIANKKEDYESFYHEMNGKRIRHDKVHNLYGYFMTKAAAEAMDRFAKGKRMLLFSRSSYIGMHRYGGIWTGDNKSWWSHLLLNIKMMPSLNMCGFLYCGADIGGFGDDATGDLLLRWLEFALFAPLMRNHSALGTRRQEITRFDQMEAMKEMIALRYRLLPYLYSEYLKAAYTGGLYFKPLAFVYEDDAMAQEVEDQLFVGESIMILPVYEQNRSGRWAYLPERMLLVIFSTAREYTEKVLEKGSHYIPIEEHQVALCIRENHLLPLGPGGQNTEEASKGDMKVLGFVTREAEYEWWTDDGVTKAEGATDEDSLEAKGVRKGKFTVEKDLKKRQEGKKESGI